MPTSGAVISILGRPYSTTAADGGGIPILTVEDITYNPVYSTTVNESSLTDLDTDKPKIARKLPVVKRDKKKGLNDKTALS